MDANREKGGMVIILLRGFMLGSQIEGDRGEERFVRGRTFGGFNAETRHIVVMLSSSGPDRRFCDYARGVTVAFTFLKLPEYCRTPNKPFFTKRVLLRVSALGTCVRGDDGELGGDLRLEELSASGSAKRVIHRASVHGRAWCISRI